MKRYFCFGESGQILPLTVILFVPMLFLSAFAIDLGSFYLRASELQTAADLAALAGAEALERGDITEAELEEFVRDILLANGFDPTDGSLSFLPDVLADGSVQINITDANVAQFFSQLITDNVRVDRSATAATGSCFGCESEITVSDGNFNFPLNGDGDGYKPLFVEVDGDLRLYALNHHVGSNQSSNLSYRNDSQLVCVNVFEERLCDSGEFQVPRLNTATALESKLTYDGGTQLFYAAQRPNPGAAETPYGIGCVGLDGRSCSSFPDFVRIDTFPEVITRRSDSGQDIHSPQTTPVVKNGRVYSIDRDLRVHCFEVAGGASCGTTSPSDWSEARARNPWSANSNYPRWRRTLQPETLELENRQYYGISNHSDFDGRIICFDLNTADACSGFGVARVEGNGIGSLWERTDGDTHTGVCWFGIDDKESRQNQLGCVDRDGNDVSSSEPLDTLLQNIHSVGYKTDPTSGSFSRLPDGVSWQPISHGDRLFLYSWNQDRADQSNDLTHCFDLNTGQVCPENGGQRVTPGRTYSYTPLPGDSDCIGTMTHESGLDFFTSDLEDCNPAQPEFRLLPCQCDGGRAEWGTLEFDDFEGSLSELVITVKDRNGVALPDFTGVAVIGPGGNGTIDLGSLPTTAPTDQLILEVVSQDTFAGAPAQNITGTIGFGGRATLVD